MKIDKAREIAAEYDLKEGATYDWYKAGLDEHLGEITVTKIKSSGRGPVEVAYRIERGDEAREYEDEIATVAGKLNDGFWRVPNSE